MKIAGIVLLLLVGLLTGLWFAYVRAPAPHEVCQRKADLVLADTRGEHAEAASSLVDHFRLTCTRQAETLLQFRGKLAYARFARCVMAAPTFDDAERCG